MLSRLVMCHNKETSYVRLNVIPISTRITKRVAVCNIGAKTHAGRRFRSYNRVIGDSYESFI